MRTKIGYGINRPVVNGTNQAVVFLSSIYAVQHRVYSERSDMAKPKAEQSTIDTVTLNFLIERAQTNGKQQQTAKSRS